MNLNSFGGIETVAMNNRIAESLPKGEFNREFLPRNAMRFVDEANQSVHQR